MSNEIQQYTPFDGYGGEVVEYQGPRMGAQMGGPAEPVREQTGMMRKMHTALRGRYWIGVVFGLIFGAAGGYFGYRSQQPVYRGEGLLQIAFNLPYVTGQSADNGPMMNFEEYVQSQAMMMSSRRIIDSAMNSADWKLTNLGTDFVTQNIIATNLTVEHPSRTELIRVYYTDKDPGVACNVVRAIINSYYTFAVNRNSAEGSKRLNLLEKRKIDLASTINRLDATILDAANKYGSANLDSMLEAKMVEESKIESQLNAADIALETAKKKKNVKQAMTELTENQIGMLDPTMRGMLIERDALQSQINQLLAAGNMEQNVKVKQVRAVMEAQQRKLEKYSLEWRDMQMKLSDDPSLGQGSIARIMQQSPQVIQAERDTLEAKYKQIKEERTDIGRQSLKIQEFQRQREELVKERADVQRRIDVLNLESGMAGRLQVISLGEVPIAPFKDRRKMFGAAGALGGFGFPMAILVFIGLMDKRYRFSDDAHQSVANVPLLGILPRLPDKLSDPEQAAVAAHCIHQIRIMLQVGNNPEKRRVFMVTSASTGDGKTSLTMALGLSFAASGSKTLVIDCDMVGQGLTHRLKAHNVPGLIETLNLGTLRGHVRKTASKGLYVLPIGNADAVHAGVLSPQSIKRLLAACREHFDIIVIDTGPILGSLEASVVAAEADGVIMAVARGQNQPLVEKAVKHLRSIGANIFGIVFNRAEQRDFQRSVASASIRSTSARPMDVRALLPDTDESARFGPLARSVASCLPASSANTPGNGEQ